MPSWKKLITSGSDALLYSVYASTSITASSAQIAGLTYPSFDGSNGQVLTTDGLGNLTFSNQTAQLTASIISSSFIDLDQITLGNEPAWQEGRIFYSAEEGALTVYNSEADIALQVGQEFWKKVKNKSGGDILNGTPVRVSGSTGGIADAYPATAPDHTTGGNLVYENHVVGIATHDISNNSVGFITEKGLVRDVDTSKFNAGDILFLQTGSPATPADYFRNDPPPFPYDVIQVGLVTVSHPTEGKIEVSPLEPIHFGNISGLSGSASTSGELWIYTDSSKNAWSPGRTLSGSYTINQGHLNVDGGITGSSITGSFTGDGANLNNVRLFISGIDLDSNPVASTFSKLQFDSTTGIYVSASDADTAFVELGSHFRDIFVEGYPTLVATGSDQLDVIAGKGISISSSLTDTNSNSVSKELIFAIDASVATTGSNTFTGNQTINGDLTVGGTVTAQEFHTEFVSASIIYTSGSTKFGDTSDDVHAFSGSLRVTGSGDHYFSDGNVGIGTTSPSARLDIAQTTNNQGIIIRSSTTQPELSFVDDSSGDSFSIGHNRAGNRLDIEINEVDTHTFTQSGNVGIGETNPSTKLVVNGTATVTALVETSTRELKKDITELEDQSSIVNSLQPVTYTWKESEEEDFGLIAEDVQEIAPHLVHRDLNGKPSGIKYSKLSVLLLDVVQRQSTLIEDLNKRITKLENERG